MNTEQIDCQCTHALTCVFSGSTSPTPTCPSGKTSCSLVLSVHVLRLSALRGCLPALSQDAVQAVELTEEPSVGGDAPVVLDCLNGLH